MYRGFIFPLYFKYQLITTVEMLCCNFLKTQMYLIQFLSSFMEGAVSLVQ